MDTKSKSQRGERVGLKLKTRIWHSRETIVCCKISQCVRSGRSKSRYLVYFLGMVEYRRRIPVAYYSSNCGLCEYRLAKNACGFFGRYYMNTIIIVNNSNNSVITFSIYMCTYTARTMPWMWKIQSGLYSYIHRKTEGKKQPRTTSTRESIVNRFKASNQSDSRPCTPAAQSATTAINSIRLAPRTSRLERALLPPELVGRAECSHTVEPAG